MMLQGFLYDQFSQERNLKSNYSDLLSEELSLSLLGG